MKKIIDFIVYSNLFIALCTALFTWQTLIIFNVNNEEAPGFIVINFISTFVLYNLQRLYYSSKLNSNKYSWYNNNRKLIFTLIFLLVAFSFNFILHFFTENKKALVAYVALSALSLVYFLPPLELRRFGVLKPVVIALVFVFIGIAMPLDFIFDKISLCYVFSQLVFIAALCVLFDIRDADHDKNLNVSTFPVKYGEKKTKIFVYLLLVIYLVISLLLQNKELLISSIVTFIVAFTLTYFADSKKNNLYYAFLVDGVIILQALIVIVSI